MQRKWLYSRRITPSVTHMMPPPPRHPDNEQKISIPVSSAARRRESALAAQVRGEGEAAFLRAEQNVEGVGLGQRRDVVEHVEVVLEQGRVIGEQLLEVAGAAQGSTDGGGRAGGRRGA